MPQPVGLSKLGTKGVVIVGCAITSGIETGSEADLILQHSS